MANPFLDAIQGTKKKKDEELTPSQRAAEAIKTQKIEADNPFLSAITKTETTQEQPKRPTVETPQQEEDRGFFKKVGDFLTQAKDKVFNQDNKQKLDEAFDVVQSNLNRQSISEGLKKIVSDNDTIISKSEEDLIRRIALKENKLEDASQDRSDLNLVQVARDPNTPEARKKVIADYLRIQRAGVQIQTGVAGLGSSILDIITQYSETGLEGDIEHTKKLHEDTGNPLFLERLEMLEDSKTRLEEKGIPTRDLSNKVKKWSEETAVSNPDFAEKAANGVGSMIGFVALTYATKGNAAIPYLTESFMEAGGTYEENRNKGLSVEESSKSADASLVMNLLLNKVLNIFDIAPGTKKSFRTVMKNASTEGLQEGGQQIISNITTGRPWDEGVLEAAGIGSTIGGVTTFALPNGQEIQIDTTQKAEDIQVEEKVEEEVTEAPVEKTLVSEVSQQATNSLENKDVGQKEGSVDRAKADIQAGKDIAPVEIRKTPEGDVVVVDGRHRLEAARQLNKEIQFTDVTTQFNKEAKGDLVQEITDSLAIAEEVVTEPTVTVEELDDVQPTVEKKPVVTKVSDEQRVDNVLKEEKERIKNLRIDESQKSKMLKAVGFETSALKRAISGKPTQTELDNTRKFLNSIHADKPVIANGETGIATGKVSFGKHEIKFEDGSTKFVERKNIKIDDVTDRNVLDHLKEKAIRDLKAREDKFGIKPETKISKPSKEPKPTGPDITDGTKPSKEPTRKKETIQVTPIKPATVRPVSSAGKLKKSKSFTRVQERLEEEYRKDIYYNEMNQANNTARAIDFVKKFPERSLRIARGLESGPNGFVTDIAIALELAEKAQRDGDYKLYAEMEKNVSLRGTRAGQEVVSFRGRFNDHSAHTFINRVLKARLEISNKAHFNFKKFKRVVNTVDKQAENVMKFVNKQTLSKIDSAQAIIDKLTC